MGMDLTMAGVVWGWDHGVHMDTIPLADVMVLRKFSQRLLARSKSCGLAGA